MTYTTYEEISKLKPGTQIWGCAFKSANGKIRMRYSQEPVFGEIQTYSYHLLEERPDIFAQYKNGSTTDFDRSVGLHSRIYADTYDECVALYNELVNEKIAYLLNQVNETKKKLIEV